MEWFQTDLLARLKELKLRRISQGHDVWDLSMINPDLPPPRVLLDKLMEAVNNPANHRYAVSRGVRKLREAFAGKYFRAFGATLDPERQICVTFGTKDAVVHSLQCLKALGFGETVIVGAPTYPAHISALHIAGYEPEFFEIRRDSGRMVQEICERLERTRRAVVLLNFPNNPTGVVVERDFYREVLACAAKRDAFVLNDFVYGEMDLGGRPGVSLLSADEGCERSAESYSLSKAYNIPGWRVGAVLGNADLVSHLAHLKSHLDYGLFLPVQLAATAALEAREDLVKETVSKYNARCRLLCDGVKLLGIEADMPAAGVSIWAHLGEEMWRGRAFGGGLERSYSIDLCCRLLEETGVVALPGRVFGRGFDTYLRLAGVTSEERIREVLRRTADFMSQMIKR